MQKMPDVRCEEGPRWIRECFRFDCENEWGCYELHWECSARGKGQRSASKADMQVEHHPDGVERFRAPRHHVGARAAGSVNRGDLAIRRDGILTRPSPLVGCRCVSTYNRLPLPRW